MNNKILTDIAGTTSPAGIPKKLAEDSKERGVQYLEKAIQSADARVLEAVEKVKSAAASEGKVLETGEQVFQHIYEQIMQRNMKPEYLALQGMVNTDSCNSGRLRGEFYEDVPTAFQKWKQNGNGIYVYSNGSEELQKALFRTAERGDLSVLVDGFFDTAKVGSKIKADGYKKIAEILKADPKEMTYLSDLLQELDAADQAGYKAVLVIRPGNKPVEENKYRAITNFLQF